MAIKWEVVMSHGLREYKATDAGIDFHIWHAVDGSRHHFGLTARRVSDKKGLHKSFGILWCGTLKGARERAESILAKDGQNE